MSIRSFPSVGLLWAFCILGCVTATKTPIEARNVHFSNQAQSISDANKLKHVIILSIDGLRPDALSPERTPHIMTLRKEGTWDDAAITIMPSITLPSHTSMLTGRASEVHKVTWNAYEQERGIIPYETCLDVAQQHGLRAGMIVGKEKFKHLYHKDQIEYFSWPGDLAASVAQEFDRYVNEKGMFDLVFLHFSDPDYAGHKNGWMSEPYLEAAHASDIALGHVLKTLQDHHLLENTAIIVTADHGGLGMTHGRDIPEDRRIPWLVNGPGIVQGQVLTTPITTYDTAATALFLLNVPVPAHWEGKPVAAVLDVGQSMAR